MLTDADAAAIEALAARIAELVGEQMVPPGLVDASAAGELLNVPASWVLAEARAERVPHIRLGRYVRFDPAALRAWTNDGHHRGPRPRGGR